MSATRDDVLNAALQLAEPDRLAIATRLLETVSDELLETVSEDLPGWSIHDPGFTAELERRSGQWEDAIPWEEVKEKLRKSP